MLLIIKKCWENIINKIILITDVNSSISKATTTKVVKNECKVYLNYVGNKEKWFNGANKNINAPL